MTDEPQPDLREQLAAEFQRLDAQEWGYDHGFSADVVNDPETASFVDAALAIFLPLLDAKQAEITRLIAFLERGFDTHMQFGVIEPDGTTTMLPCADWCNACKLERAEAERERLRLAWRSARGRALDLADARDEAVEAWDDTLQDLIEVRAELNQQKHPSLRGGAR